MNETNTGKVAADQLEKLQKIRKRIAQLEAREQAILARKSRQQRADATRRSIVLGKRIEGLAVHHRGAKAMMQMLLVDLDAQYQYLFPEIWPDAKRPTKTDRPRARNAQPMEVIK